MSPCEWSQMWPNSAPSQAAQRGRRAISQVFLKTAGVGQACIESYGHVYGATVSIVTDAKMSGEDGRQWRVSGDRAYLHPDQLVFVETRDVSPGTKQQ